MIIFLTLFALTCIAGILCMEDGKGRYVGIGIFGMLAWVAGGFVLDVLSNAGGAVIVGALTSSPAAGLVVGLVAAWLTASSRQKRRKLTIKRMGHIIRAYKRAARIRDMRAQRRMNHWKACTWCMDDRSLGQLRINNKTATKEQISEILEGRKGHCGYGYTMTAPGKGPVSI